MQNEPWWLIIFRVFVLAAYPVMLSVNLLSRDLADSFELLFFAWFLLLVVVLPSYFVFELVALFVVWKRPKYRNYVGSNKARLLWLAFLATEALAFWMTRVFGIGMRVQ